MLQIAFRYGILMFLGFTAFFFLMHLFGLSDVLQLRYFNLIIHLSVLWMVMRVWVRKHPDRFDNYSENVGLGLLTTGVGAGAFAIFLTLFLAASPALMDSIRAQSPRVLADSLNPVMAGVFTFGEGIIAALIGSYVLIRIMEVKYYRTN